MGKGSEFEREICRTLSMWWSNGKRDDLFWRSAGSGAMAKTRSKKGKTTSGQYGDIQATDVEGKDLLKVFTIELKRGYNADNFLNMLDKPSNAAMQGWEKFYQQVKKDFKNAKSRTWIIIWRRDRKKALVYFSLKIAELLCNNTGADLYNHPYLKGKLQVKSESFVSVYVCSLEDFLKSVKPNHVRRILNGRSI